MTTQNALEAIGVSVDGVSKETLVAIVRRLQAENEQLRKDAERYQWLRELVSSTVGTIQAQGLFWNCSHSRRKLDAALDAARSAKALPEPAP